jgi:tetratricopeptide (TPR) repeat protein
MEKYISAVEGSAGGASIMMTYLIKNMEKACRILNINCENLPAYEKAVALNEARLNPPQNPQKEDSVKALRERAWHEYNEKQNYEKGYELMFSALKLGRKQWGKKSGNLVDLHSGLSLMAKRLGKYTVAEKCLKANVALGEASKLGSRKRMHVHACFALAELYEKQLKDEKKAEYWFRESVKVAQKQFGRDHVDTAYYYSSLGRYYTGHNSVREGVELLERSRDIYFKSEGPESTRGLQHEQTIKNFRQAQ